MYVCVCVYVYTYYYMRLPLTKDERRKTADFFADDRTELSISQACSRLVLVETWALVAATHR